MAQPRPVLNDLQFRLLPSWRPDGRRKWKAGPKGSADIDRGLIRQRKPRRSRAEVEQAGHQGRRECPYRSVNSQVPSYRGVGPIGGWPVLQHPHHNGSIACFTSGS